MTAAEAVAAVAPALAFVAAVPLGAGYGLCLLFGISEVTRIAAPDELAGLTAAFYGVTYLGMFGPPAFTLLGTLLPMPLLLTGAAALALLSLTAVTRGT